MKELTDTLLLKIYEELNNESNITIPNKPITVKVSDWLIQHYGRFSIGIRNNDGTGIIYAFTDDDDKIPKLAAFAKNNNMHKFHSIIMEGITSIELIL